MMLTARYQERATSCVGTDGTSAAPTAFQSGFNVHAPSANGSETTPNIAVLLHSISSRHQP